MRFSEYFKLNKSQAELDFVDIPIDTDIRLFVDPYAIEIESDLWFNECHNLIVDYFEILINTIKKKDRIRAVHLLSNLHEPNDTHLGYSGDKLLGKGIGNIQGETLYNKLAKSKAAQSGLLQDLGDCELLIEGISSDKISDITINIIRGKLLEYTFNQCYLHNIDMANVPSGSFWDDKDRNWKSRYAHLPVFEGRGILLVPKVIVRHRVGVDHRKYYRNYYLDYLRSEYLKAGHSLVRTLKNGKKTVYKKDLMKKHPLSKDDLLEFSIKHSAYFENYKNAVFENNNILRDEEIEEFRDDYKKVDYNKLIVELNSIQPGASQADMYHNICIGILNVVFYPRLRNPKKEQPLNDGRKRIDITYDNGAKKGFFKNLKSMHDIKSPYIFCECKNYSEDPKNPEFDQLSGRLSEKWGMFGILLCRDIKDKAAMIKKCKDYFNSKKECIVVLEDLDVKKLINYKMNREETKIDDYMSSKLREIIL